MRYILRWRGPGSTPAEDVELVVADPEANVLDVSSRMLLVESAPGPIERLLAQMPQWAASPEVEYQVPDPTPRVRKRNSGDVMARPTARRRASKSSRATTSSDQ